MRQHEAVIKVMEENGGYATLGFLNCNVLKIQDCKWNTKTPFASIRRIVQNEDLFFKLRPGLWALKSYRDKLPEGLCPSKNLPKNRQEEYSHSYYQGLLVELGNMKKYQTFVPHQDKNRSFLNNKLSEISTLSEIYKFSYDKIIRTTQTVDVLWFNHRNMPVSLFEIEHSTNIHNSLLKFVEIQDFYTKFYIVADSVREREFRAKIAFEAFKPIYKRVEFLSYQHVAELHSKTSELQLIQNKLDL